MESRIREIVAQTLTELGAPDTAFVVEWPGDLSHGDYATNAALAAAKALGKSPREVAEAIAAALRTGLGDIATEVSVAGPGFVNVTLSSTSVIDALAAIPSGEAWGMGMTRAGETVVFEYSCPNPFKEMHIGHLMSTVIGEAVSRLIESQGARVVRDTYGGDVGPHVAKALWELIRKGVTEPESPQQIGEAYAHGSRAYEESESAKAEIDALNTRLYEVLAKDGQERDESDRALVELWRKGRDMSYESHQSIWKALGTSFDYIIHESETTPIGLRVVHDGLTRGVFEASDGAVIYRGEKQGLHTLVFITSRNTPTYETKDVGLAFLKEERIAPFDYSYIVTAAEQSGHFAVFLAALSEIAPELAKKTMHVPHGFLRLTEGKMSSREGNVITAAGLIEDVLGRAAERNEDPLVAHAVALGAIKFMILRQAPGGDIIFDPEKSLSLEGDSGPYLQYALVRARSVLAQATATPSLEAESPSVPFVLARLIARFPQVVARAEHERAPHALVQYLLTLAGEWNSFYAKERINGGTYEAYKLALAEAFAHTMERGLTILGIPVPERM